MILQRLTISRRMPYSAPGPGNPMVATVQIRDLNETELTVTVPDDILAPLMDALVGVAADAAERQMGEFVRLARSDQVNAIAVAGAAS